MPGFSLWLVPPEHSPIYAALSTLIVQALPAHFPAVSPPPPKFIPHVTLTADVPLEAFSQDGAADEAQQKRDAEVWLTKLLLDLPADANVRVQFEALDVGDKFVQRLTLRTRKSGVQELARVCRLHGVVAKGGDKDAVEHWLNDSYRPHCSLVYGSMPISDGKKSELQSEVEQAGISIDGSGEMGGWLSGEVWLVPTFKSIPEWEPWVRKTL